MERGREGGKKDNIVCSMWWVRVPPEAATGKKELFLGLHFLVSRTDCVHVHCIYTCTCLSVRTSRSHSAQLDETGAQPQ